MGSFFATLRTTSLVSLAALAGLVPAAGAETAPAPRPACQGWAFTDPAGDQSALTVPAGFAQPSTDLRRGFLLYDPATGTTRYNIQVADLETTVPPPYTTIGWIGYFTAPDGSASFVRAIVDLTGSVVYEYGGPDMTVPTLTRNVYKGDTTGRLFLGKDGIVSIDIPKSLAPAGGQIERIYANAFQGTTLPNAAPPQATRGVFYTDDASDDEGAVFNVAPCPENAT